MLPAAAEPDPAAAAMEALFACLAKDVECLGAQPPDGLDANDCAAAALFAAPEPLQYRLRFTRLGQAPDGFFLGDACCGECTVKYNESRTECDLPGTDLLLGFLAPQRIVFDVYQDGARLCSYDLLPGQFVYALHDARAASKAARITLTAAPAYARTPLFAVGAVVDVHRPDRGFRPAASCVSEAAVALRRALRAADRLPAMRPTADV